MDIPLNNRSISFILSKVVFRLNSTLSFFLNFGYNINVEMGQVINKNQMRNLNIIYHDIEYFSLIFHIMISIIFVLYKVLLNNNIFNELI